MNNADIRFELIKTGIKHYQAAEAIGVSAEHFSRMLRHELSDEQKARIREAISKIKQEVVN